MSLTEVNLGDALIEIYDQGKTYLEREAVEGGRLGKIPIVEGQRIRSGKVSFPIVWIYTEIATQEQTRAHSEIWTLPMVVTGMARDGGDPENARRQAVMLAAEARSILLREARRSTNAYPWELAYVHDVRSQSFDGDASLDQDRGIASAIAIVEVRFTIRDGFDN